MLRFLRDTFILQRVKTQRTVERSAFLAAGTGHGTDRDWASEQENDDACESLCGGFFWLFLTLMQGCVCVCGGACVSGDGSVVRYEASSAAFGCGRAKQDWLGFVCVGDCFSAQASYVPILNTLEKLLDQNSAGAVGL